MKFAVCRIHLLILRYFGILIHTVQGAFSQSQQVNQKVFCNYIAEISVLWLYHFIIIFLNFKEQNYLKI